MIPRAKFVPLFALVILCAFGRAFTAAAVETGAGSKLGAYIPSKIVAAGAVWSLEQTTRLDSLTLGAGAQILAPAGKSVTLTVDGVEKDISPGDFTGDVLLSVTDPYVTRFTGMPGAPSPDYQFRQALMLNAAGVVAGQSVMAAAGQYTYQNGVLDGVSIKSTGGNFNGIVATGGQTTVRGAHIDLSGDASNDFIGYGAAILAVEPGTTLIVDGARIHTHGVVRTAVVADKGSNLIVENSTIDVHDGTLPADYIPNVTPGRMWAPPWMLSLSGNVRATNLLGDGTRATYINSSVSSERWGVLSVDIGANSRLTAINCTLRNTAGAGYGSYAVGNSINTFLGTTLDVADYAQIITGGDAVFAASIPSTISQLNTDYRIGLSAKQITALARQETRVRSARFGVMWHGDGVVTIRDGTTFDTAETTFLDKGSVAKIWVDGSKGARLTPGNGVLVQVMEDDDPGPKIEGGLAVNDGVYHEPTHVPAKAKDFDVTKVNATDVQVTFANISLTGDLFNAARGDGGPPPMAALAPATGGGPPPPLPGGRNMVVYLDHTSLAGVISSSNAKHRKDTLSALDFELVGEVSNTVSAAVNNGVIVALNKARWTVTGDAYLTSLTLDADSQIVAPPGSKLSVRVNNQPQLLKPGTYTGLVVLHVTKG